MARHATYVRLVQGESITRIFRFTNDDPAVRITVGSSAEATWQIVASGVTPLHLALVWDGETLWVADPAGRSRRAWHARIEFGEAAFQVNSIFEAEVVPIDTPLREEKTRVASTDEVWVGVPHARPV